MLKLWCEQGIKLHSPCVSWSSCLFASELSPWEIADVISPWRSLASTGGTGDDGSDELDSSSCKGTLPWSIDVSSVTGFKSFANSSSLSAGSSPSVALIW